MAGLLHASTQHFAAFKLTHRCRQQRLVVCSAHGRNEHQQGQNAPLFQLDERHNLTMADVRDAYEICSLIPDPNERYQCYSVFGVDGQRMAQYYDNVVKLEDQFQTDYHQHSAPCVVLNEDDPDDYLQAPAECSLCE